MEEPKMGFVPQAQTQRVAIFGHQRIFVNASEYHWHVYGAIGVDDEARQQLVALTNQLYNIGHQIEE